jgi:hypothetical protein
MASTVDERVFLVAMFRLASNHTGTRSHLQRINFVQYALCQCAMEFDTIDHKLWECELYCTLRNELQGMDHGKSIRDILAIRNMVAPKNYSLSNFSQTPGQKRIRKVSTEKF